jgi:nitric oxide reductase NorE protein
MSAGHTIGDFFMYYFTLTGLHLAHVLAGCAVLSVFLARWRSSPGPASPGGFESAAIFWHLVDLLWVLIFPFLYLVR